MASLLPSEQQALQQAGLVQGEGCNRDGPALPQRGEAAVLEQQ